VPAKCGLEEKSPFREKYSRRRSAPVLAMKREKQAWQKSKRFQGLKF
jgi:hypothetical protein